MPSRGNGNGAIEGLCDGCAANGIIKDLQLRHLTTERESTNLVAEFHELRDTLVSHMKLLSGEIAHLTRVVHEAVSRKEPSDDGLCRNCTDG